MPFFKFNKTTGLPYPRAMISSELVFPDCSFNRNTLLNIVKKFEKKFQENNKMKTISTNLNDPEYELYNEVRRIFSEVYNKINEIFIFPKDFVPYTIQILSGPNDQAEQIKSNLNTILTQLLNYIRQSETKLHDLRITSKLILEKSKQIDELDDIYSYKKLEYFYEQFQDNYKILKRDFCKRFSQSCYLNTELKNFKETYSQVIDICSNIFKEKKLTPRSMTRFKKAVTKNEFELPVSKLFALVNDLDSSFPEASMPSEYKNTHNFNSGNRTSSFKIVSKKITIFISSLGLIALGASLILFGYGILIGGISIFFGISAGVAYPYLTREKGSNSLRENYVYSDKLSKDKRPCIPSYQFESQPIETSFYNESKNISIFESVNVDSPCLVDGIQGEKNKP